MGLLRRNSLAATLDAVGEAFFAQRPLPRAHREEVARWIAGRQGLSGSYGNMFAPTEADFTGGVRLFTGESVRSRAGTAHILGEEACRALILLGVPSTRAALERASDGLAARLAAAHGSRPAGMFCCGVCSVALWRHLATGGLDGGERRLAAGLEALQEHRDGRGRWRRFPFYYTLLVLSEIDTPRASAERRYAAAACERVLGRSGGRHVVASRRQAVMERVLAA